MKIGIKTFQAKISCCCPKQKDNEKIFRLVGGKRIQSEDDLSKFM